MRNTAPITPLERQKKHTWTLGSFSLLLKVVYINQDVLYGYRLLL